MSTYCAWENSLFIDWRFGNRTRKFRWSTTAPGVTAGVWQVIEGNVFVDDPKDWRKPKDLVSHGTAPWSPTIDTSTEGKQKYSFFEIDFAKFAPGPNDPQPFGVETLRTGEVIAPKPQSKVAAMLEPLKAIKTASEPAESDKFSQVKEFKPEIAQKSIVSKTAFDIEPSPDAAKIAAQDKTDWHYPSPLGTYVQHPPPLIIFQPDPKTYVIRIVPVNAQGERVGKDSPAVTILYGTPKSQGIVLPESKQEEQPKLPTVQIIGYDPPNTNTEPYHFIITKPPPELFKAITGKYQVGQKVYWPPTPQHKKDLWDQIVGAVGDFFSAIGNWIADAVNWVADAYDYLKSKAIDLVAGLIPGCEQECRAWLTKGLNIGLVALGLPPSLPKMDNLLQMGKEYVVQQILDQASITGITPEQAMDIVENLAAEAKKTAEGGDDPFKWFMPDPDYVYRDAILTLHVSNSTAETTDKVQLVVNDWSELYKSHWLPIPPMKPGQSFKIPLVLEQDIDYWYKQYVKETQGYPTKSYGSELWWDHYNKNPDASFEVKGGAQPASLKWKAQSKYGIAAT